MLFLACNRRPAEEIDEMIAEAYLGGVSQRKAGKVAEVTKDRMAESRSEPDTLNGAV